MKQFFFNMKKILASWYFSKKNFKIDSLVKTTVLTFGTMRTVRRGPLRVPLHAT